MRLLILPAVAAVAFSLAISFSPKDAKAEVHRGFVYAQSCSAPFGAPNAGFAIPGTRDLSVSGIEQVWIDLSLQASNFQPGTFLSAGPFVPRHGALEFRWYGLEPVRTHYYRLNGLRMGEWIEIGRGSFETINCGVVEGMECRIGDAEGKLSVQFGVAPAYSPAGQPALEQWFDLTIRSSRTNPILDGGWEPGTFLGWGPFPATGGRFTWHGILPEARHFYRQNTLYGSGWQQQYGGSFVALDCHGLPAFDPPG